ncbi:Unknown protein sequence [Pseudomonas amygdali pv. myricae]|nr:Unknown protein sequence [Pseudomonas amygdali pv. myricae]
MLGNLCFAGVNDSGWHISQAAVTQGDSQPAASWQRDA